LAEGKIAPVVILSHEAKQKCMILHWRIRTGSDSILSDQDWIQTEKFHSPLISAKSRFSITVSEANHAGWPDISAKADLCVANWWSLAREIFDFSYFSKF